MSSTPIHQYQRSPIERAADHLRRVRERSAARQANVPISNASNTQPYDDAELRPFSGRTGAMDAYALPSRMGERLVYPRGQRVGESGVAP